MRKFRSIFLLERIRTTVLGAFLLCASTAYGQTVQDDLNNPNPFVLGVQTHLSQGWSLDALALLRELSTNAIRDEVSWTQVEKQASVLDFAGPSPYMDAIRNAGVDPLILFIGANKNYDDGTTPYTDEGRQAFARYVTSVLAAYPDTIKQIEIGNEYNTDAVDGPFREDAGIYTGLLIAAVAPAVKEAHPNVRILCTGAHSVATGYFRKVFETGALDYCDAISFHPYREQPENIDVEIQRLRELMLEFGGEKPLFATEFGKWFEDPTEAPDYLLKMVSLMGSAGVSGAYWYALLNEEWWPNMGLFKDYSTEMPAASAFRFLQNKLLPLGRPISKSQRGEDHLYEFGTGGKAFVAWGAPGVLNIEGAAQFFDSSGNAIDPVTRLSAQPVVITGDAISVKIEREREVYSAFFGYGTDPWSYLALKPDGSEVPFQVMDWNWNPYFGDPYHNPMKVAPTGVAGAVFGGDPFYTIERFTAPESGEYQITGRWFRNKPDADGADVRLSKNGEAFASGLVNGESFEWGPTNLMLKADDVMDFAVGPNAEPGGEWLYRDITIEGP